MVNSYYDIIFMNFYQKIQRKGNNMSPNILIVDDDVQTLKTLSQYLEGHARVSTVIGGRQALEYVHQNHVDIILLDIEMPIMDGYLTLEQLRKTEECINVPIIFLSGKSDKNTILNSSLLGVDGFLVKPISEETLINKIEEVYKIKEEKHNKKTVLMIDDDMSYLKQMNNLLQDKYNVIMINSAKLALNYLLKHTPDIILLDYQMPLYNGANVMNMIQKNSIGRPAPVIILSGALDRDALQECYSYNPAAFLAKPVTKEVLVENIDKVLNS